MGPAHRDDEGRQQGDEGSEQRTEHHKEQHQDEQHREHLRVRGVGVVLARLRHRRRHRASRIDRQPRGRMAVDDRLLDVVDENLDTAVGELGDPREYLDLLSVTGGADRTRRGADHRGNVPQTVEQGGYVGLVGCRQRRRRSVDDDDDERLVHVLDAVRQCCCSQRRRGGGEEVLEVVLHDRVERRQEAHRRD
jgi:hypothetical protein